jgi:hypothetical protein
MSSSITFGATSLGGLGINQAVTIKPGGLIGYHTWCCFTKLTTLSGGQQVLWQPMLTLHVSWFQILYDTASTKIGLFGGPTPAVLVTTITPTLGQWYFIAYTLSASGTGSSATTTWTIYIKPVGAATCRVFSFTGTGTTYPAQQPDFLGLGNVASWSGSTTSTEPWEGSICGVKYWNGVSLTQEEIERESEQIAPVRRSDLFWYFPLTHPLDLYPQQFVEGGQTPWVAFTPANLSQGSGPPIPEYKDAGFIDNTAVWGY